MSAALASTIRSHVRDSREAIMNFFREIVAIPSYDSQIQAVGERVGAEMRRLGYDEVRFDQMGNIIGRIGSGNRVLVYDSHIDTVGIGDPSAWQWDPFTGKVENGVLFARGACDEKGSTPGMVYGLAIARELAELMGGSVELDLSDRRTRFALVLPASSEALPFSPENERVEEPSLQ